jgi:hypothetical protein
VARRAGDRPYLVLLVANLAVFAAAVGPAAVAGLLRLTRMRRGTPRLVLAGATMASVLVVDLSGLSKVEVEAGSVARSSTPAGEGGRHPVLHAGIRRSAPRELEEPARLDGRRWRDGR